MSRSSTPVTKSTVCEIACIRFSADTKLEDRVRRLLRVPSTFLAFTPRLRCASAGTITWPSRAQT
eukprot:6109791-Prymnesium_polylepis.1